MFVFPTFMGALWAIKSVILFKRGSIADKEVRSVLCASGRNGVGMA